MRIMALDFGDARTGVAISDENAILVGQTYVIHARQMEQAAQQAAELAEQCGAGRLVIGFPKNMDGTDGARSDLYRAFAERVGAITGLETVLWDERRTSIDAHRILSANGRKTKQHRKQVDAVAASLILESYLQYLENRHEVP